MLCGADILSSLARVEEVSTDFVCVGIGALGLLGGVSLLIFSVMKDNSREGEQPPEGTRTPQTRPPPMQQTTMQPRRSTEDELADRERRVREAERLADLEEREAALRQRAQHRRDQRAHCNRCGAELRHVAAFCAQCGQRRD